MVSAGFILSQNTAAGGKSAAGAVKNAPATGLSAGGDAGEGSGGFAAFMDMPEGAAISATPSGMSTASSTMPAALPSIPAAPLLATAECVLSAFSASSDNGAPATQKQDSACAASLASDGKILPLDTTSTPPNLADFLEGRGASSPLAINLGPLAQDLAEGARMGSLATPCISETIPVSEITAADSQPEKTDPSPPDFSSIPADPLAVWMPVLAPVDAPPTYFAGQLEVVGVQSLATPIAEPASGATLQTRYLAQGTGFAAEIGFEASDVAVPNGRSEPRLVSGPEFSAGSDANPGVSSVPPGKQLAASPPEITARPSDFDASMAPVPTKGGETNALPPLEAFAAQHPTHAPMRALHNATAPAQGSLQKAAAESQTAVIQPAATAEPQFGSEKANEPLSGAHVSETAPASHKAGFVVPEAAAAQKSNAAHAAMPPAQAGSMSLQATTLQETAVQATALAFLTASDPKATHETRRPTPLAILPIEIGMQALRGAREFQVRLDPIELGRIDVTLQINDQGEVQARLRVDRPETLALLTKDQHSLQQAFEQAGLKASPDSLSFSLRGDSSGHPSFGHASRDSGGQDHPHGAHKTRLEVAEYASGEHLPAIPVASPARFSQARVNLSL